jgi:hypothetical protein
MTARQNEPTSCHRSTMKRLASFVISAQLLAASTMLIAGCQGTIGGATDSKAGLAEWVGLWSAGRSTFEASSIRVFPDGNILFLSAGCFGTWFSWHEGTVEDGILIVSPPLITYSKERFEGFVFREVRGSKFLVPRESIDDWDPVKELSEDASERIGYKRVEQRTQGKKP